jgi:hypothetical protein
MLNIYIAWQFCVGGQKHSFLHVMMIWKEKIKMVSMDSDLLDLSFQKTIYDNL